MAQKIVNALSRRLRLAMAAALWRLLVPVLRLRARTRLSRLRPDEVTVVTVNWDSRTYLEVLLRLVRQRSPLDVRILVVDNGSHDG